MPRGKRRCERHDTAAAQVATPRKIEVTARERIAVEAVLGHELHRHAQHAVRTEAAVFLENERRLEIVVKGDDARSVRAKIVGRCLLLQVDEDPFHDVRVVHRARHVHRLGDDVFVNATALEHLQEQVFADATGEKVCVKRVDVGVGLGVVTEERLAAGRPFLPAFDRRGA